MRISDIITRGKSYLLLGFVGAAVLSILTFISYFIVYKKLLKGNKTFPLGKLIVFDVFVCYIAVVVGATFLDRSHYGGSNLQLFSSHKMAWYNASSYDWRYIALNVALFVPMGVLLPLLIKKLQALWKIALAGLSATVIIEAAQHAARLGIFDVDDIFNNFLGAIIGGGTFLGIIHIARCKKLKIKAVVYFLPLTIVVLGFASLRVSYSIKELGNMPSTYYYKQDMSRIELSCPVILTDDKPMSKIYRAGVFTKAEAYTFAEQFFARLGASMHPDRRPDLYDETGYYYSDNQHILTVDYKTKAYRFDDFSYYDLEFDPSAQETDIRKLLSDFNINIPEEAEYINRQDGTYTFAANVCESSEAIIDGSLMCSYYTDGAIKIIDNHLVECVYVRDCAIISQQDAFELIQQGKFNMDCTVKFMQIEDVQLAYALDTKGFYQPVYRFTVVVDDGTKINILIPALDN